jgi:probable HAF family extracellular repeat protein
MGFGNPTSGAYYGINDAGVVAGWYETELFGKELASKRAVIGGTTFDSFTGTGYPSYATAVNSQTDATGAAKLTFNDHDPFFAFLWPGGSARVINLGALPGGTHSNGSGINDNDAVVGTSAADSGGSRAFRYRDGGCRISAHSAELTAVPPRSTTPGKLSAAPMMRTEFDALSFMTMAR